MDANFRDMLSALSEAGAEFLVVEAYTPTAPTPAPSRQPP